MKVTVRKCRNLTKEAGFDLLVKVTVRRCRNLTKEAGFDLLMKVTVRKCRNLTKEAGFDLLVWELCLLLRAADHQIYLGPVVKFAAFSLGLLQNCFGQIVFIAAVSYQPQLQNLFF